MTTKTYDAVIIGSGPGGGTSAWSLARAGAKVLLLEAGPAYDYTEDYRLDQEDWEAGRFPEKAGRKSGYRIPRLQRLEDTWLTLRSWNKILGSYERSGYRRKGRYWHVQGVGGSTLHYTGEAHRLHPRSMELKTRYGIGADWPFDYAALEPFYDQAERLLGVAGPATDTVRWRSKPYPMPAHALSYASRKMARGFERSGLTLVPNPVAILSRPYRGHPPCNYCANCARGCPRADKGSVDLRCVAPAVETGNCRIETMARVIRLEPGKGDKVDSVIYVDGDGNRQEVRGRAVIVACGAVETPRLLLVSEGSRAPNGLANESGQVGRNMLETLFWISTGLHPEPLASYRGIPTDSIAWEFSAPDAVPGVIGGCRFSPGAAQGELLGPIGYATRVVDGWGRAHKSRLREVFGRAVTVAGVGEWPANAKSYVDLDPEAKDDLGIPLARFFSHLEESDLQRLLFMAEKTRQIMKEAGVPEIIEEFSAYDSVSATHVFGTCRMGRDPDSSVVDGSCRSHRWKNLFVVDASVFPTSGGGEAPTLTIVAVALRAAQGIARRLKTGSL